MGPFNNGLPLEVVRVDTGDIGLVDEVNRRVWLGKDLTSTAHVHWSSVVDIPAIPTHYGRWQLTSIGGLSETVRRTGILHVNEKHTDPVVVFVTHAPDDMSIITKALDAQDIGYVVGDVEEMDGHGRVVEIVVHDPDHLSCAAAVVARSGATPILEDSSVDSRRAIGIERLDRIDAKIVSRDTNMEHESEDAYGVRRGQENWRFPWIPFTWKRVPLTLDHIVDNLIHEEITHIPQPIRQHVAHHRVEMGLYDPVGTIWTKSKSPPTLREINGGVNMPYPYRIVIENEMLSTTIASGRTVITSEERCVWGLDYINHDRYILQATDGVWYCPRNTLRELCSHIHRKRQVSCALTEEQSKQLCTCFYLLHVERVTDVVVRTAIHMILFRYMIERGYTSRRMGKYTQDAMHVGNGNSFRLLNSRLTQYARNNRPAAVLNRLCGRNAHLKTRGSKGSRSKYRESNRYRPSRRLTRSREDEEAMVTMDQ